ncbi:sensor histidine kinase [Nocardia aurantia]|uniref:Signal transduction histidine kinase subgroup 3 dimerisation and phosphoacceptor domain-containing protein n=1 Tax=Nocardia aurantia TaxID=2585199 RepID=A0A7K0DLI6_9NOCA|nr:sensor histidine kinase [Nocardia aurantia]MQY26633.1 hypothetical protein [Nocardia aurantia]
MPLAGLPRRWSRALDRAAERSANAGGSASRRPGFGGLLAGGMAIVWLLYLLGPIHQAWVHGHHLRAVLAGVCVVGYGTLIATTLAAYRGPDWEDGVDPPAPGRGAWIRLAAMTVLFAAVLALLGSAAVPSVLYLAVVAILVLPLRQSGIIAGLVAVLAAGLALVPGWRLGGGTIFLALVPPVIWLGREVGTRGRRLRELTRRQQAELAIVAERNRVARDVHDILGHSLTVITVKSELAQRLLDIDPERARVELADVERLAREALAGVRDTVGGLREVSLAGELANARTALHAAGIAADLPDTDVPGDRGVVLGWVLREAVTNVVRHSRARHCYVRVTPSAIDIVDDGQGLAVGARFGSGLSGLRERVCAAGGAFTLTTPPGGGLRLAVSFEDGGSSAREDRCAAGHDATHSGGTRENGGAAGGTIVPSPAAGTGAVVAGDEARRSAVTRAQQAVAGADDVDATAGRAQQAVAGAEDVDATAGRAQQAVAGAEDVDATAGRAQEAVAGAEDVDATAGRAEKGVAGDDGVRRARTSEERTDAG